MFKEKINEKTDDIFTTQVKTENSLVHLKKSDVFPLENNSANEEFLDKLLSGIKFLFLYVPGAIAIQLVAHYLKSAIFFSERLQISWLALSEVAVIGIFLTMAGISKLTDLKYLKVPATIFAFSALLVVIEAFFTTGSRVEIPELLRVLSLALPITLAHFVKRKLDEN